MKSWRSIPPSISCWPCAGTGMSSATPAVTASQIAVSKPMSRRRLFGQKMSSRIMTAARTVSEISGRMARTLAVVSVLMTIFTGVPLLALRQQRDDGLHPRLDHGAHDLRVHPDDNQHRTEHHQRRLVEYCHVGDVGEFLLVKL